MDSTQQAPLSKGILQARILEWVAMTYSRGSSQPRDQIQVSHIAGRFFTIWATRESICYISLEKFNPNKCSHMFINICKNSQYKLLVSS